ncbi:hypothetical protein QBZ16_002543 [Prototheca wickerhamii]|uniref:Uncharacterized protein n=1 Tax=Prototheca wickerhamii TaxID=3111 RepID=A0AAD9MJN0_PROWI|nr:hypothetical protein QBZ16_002543 [Prototheca wickerhamii]
MTYAYARFYVPFPTERHLLKWTGTAEYTNQPGIYIQAWPLRPWYTQMRYGEVGGGPGCFAKVASAAPGSRILFRLTSTVAGKFGVKVLQLEPTLTWGGAFYTVTGSDPPDTNFTGTVEYVNMPGTKWDVTAYDPRTEYVNWNLKELKSGLCEYQSDIKK